MLDLLGKLLVAEPSEKAVVAATGCLIAVASLVPPLLLFSCKAITKNWQRSPEQEALEAQVDASIRKKLE
ncbi:MAG: hypothetical protein JSR17_04585 [Proteobacteria bacterium]|nr:hypothetical protein [Pseudomonadota bacterium]